MVNSSEKFLLKLSTRRLALKFPSAEHAIFCSVFFLAFSFSFPSGNSSIETLSANLKVVEADSERRENRYDVFTSEDFRLLPVIGKG